MTRIASRRLATLLALTALSPLPAAASSAPSPILTTPEARDVLSYAEPATARVRHVDLDLAIDFDRQVIAGTATLDLIATRAAKRIVLDGLDLDIATITDARGRALTWSWGAADDYKGAPITVEIGTARRIVIRYATRPDARALQWLPPELTLGKAKPYLFSQGQSINTRSWIPTQDSPGIRQTWSARVTATQDLRVAMSAEAQTQGCKPASPGRRSFCFRMDNPVPPYLIAMAVGDIGFRPLGPRSGVYAEPAMLDRAAKELSDTEKMIDAAESLYGAYRWGRFDVLVLPPSFPFGGMENPRLTFATPTIITGDKSNINVIGHELAHSWSGNLVTNATWSDSWLNEGFTTYFENRIDEAVYGKERAATLADLGWDDMQRDLAAAKPEATRLHGEPEGTAGQLDYYKGSTFLRTIEQAVGRARWDAYLKSYFDRHAFQPQTSAGFLADLRRNLIGDDAALEARLQLDDWVYGTGLPSNAVHVKSATLARIDADRARFEAGAPARSIDTKAWSTQEWLRFLDRLPRRQTTARLAEIDEAYALSASPNPYVRNAWLQLAIGNRYEPALGSIEDHLTHNGRILLIAPVYRALMKECEWGTAIAWRIYGKAKATYHPVTRASIERTLGKGRAAS
ncbi:M1 family metallopeptidase [Novosphingobium sp. JCM 18896]|uniref:M1 family metallopeptidase n=1 Tax=Novosphingobium sp. JCM 18896 TaxID=2989731 RepID=UPI0022216D8B|nr:M1 family metallopeptidase [Novosphingobium sp. JCM 18896]MCW1431093.1 M1 family metallopeptidase [Novosphingobium sp. JCM 18896]